MKRQDISNLMRECDPIELMEIITEAQRLLFIEKSMRFK